MENNNCVIVKESEWEETKRLAQNAKYWNKEYNRVSSEVEKLRKIKSDNTINIDFTCYLKQFSPTSYDYSTSSHNITIEKHPISHIDVEIEGSKLTIEGKLKDIIYSIKSNLYKTLKDDIYKHIDTHINQLYEMDNSKLMANNSDMHNAISKHNHLPWYKRFKKIEY